jgi:hypothetical protein
MNREEFIEKYKNYLFLRIEPCCKPEKLDIGDVIIIISNSLGDGGDDVLYVLFEKGDNLNYRIDNNEYNYCFSEAELVEIFER